MTINKLIWPYKPVRLKTALRLRYLRTLRIFFYWIAGRLEAIANIMDNFSEIVYGKALELEWVQMKEKDD